MLRSAHVPRAASTHVTSILHIQEYMGTSEGHWCGSRRQRSLCRTEGRWCGSSDSTPELTPLYHIFRTWVTTPSIETSIPAMSVRSSPAPSIFELLSILLT